MLYPGRPSRLPGAAWTAVPGFKRQTRGYPAAPAPGSLVANNQKSVKKPLFKMNRLWVSDEKLSYNRELWHFKYQPLWRAALPYVHEFHRAYRLHYRAKEQTLPVAAATLVDAAPARETAF